MGWNDHVDFELSDLVGDLVDEGLLEEGTPAFGIAQQVIHQGEGSLSDKQRCVYESVVVAALQKLGERRRIEGIIASNPD